MESEDQKEAAEGNGVTLNVTPEILQAVLRKSSIHPATNSK